MRRRTFLAAGGALASAPRLLLNGATRPPIDFRYAPLHGQTAFCFPDDAYKSLAGEKGDLRYGYDRRKKVNYFTAVAEFSMRGMEQDRVVRQQLEAPGVPIVHTRIERPEAWLELTTFATNRQGEGRVDNVLMEVRPKSARTVWTAPVIHLRTRQPATERNDGGTGIVNFDSPFLLADCPLRMQDAGDGYVLTAPEAPARPGTPLRCFLRFPQQRQEAATLTAGLRQPDQLLQEAREFWRNWRPFANGVDFELPGEYQRFLTACTRNILQARERVDGKLTFQVGPTTYRGLWVVDGNFILEAGRYLGYDEEVQQGLETTWGMQHENGQVEAAVLGAHWKDTGIAMFSLVRQAELAQDWSYFRKMQPNVMRGVKFLESIREKAKQEGSANGKYGLLAKGFGDGGIGGGVRDEFTNTIWVLAGLRAVTEAARAQGVTGFDEALSFYGKLRESFFDAARKQMRAHPEGFEYLPMLLKEDPGWTEANQRMRPRPQTGCWALAHGIFPGLVFTKDDPVVKGYIALMRAVTQEDVPIETGWLPHQGLWNYDAAFCAHACLWAGERDYALSTFHGFLNHATPLYCWREEQPLQNGLTGGYVGDMPHNWASAECVLFLRHMLALEDGRSLRLLAGIDEQQLEAGEPYALRNSPTRSGRVTLRLEPDRAARSWHLKFERAGGPQPDSVEVPESLGRLHLKDVSGASQRSEPGRVLIAPGAQRWEAVWREA